MNIQWYKNDDQLSPSANVKIETSCSESKLRLLKCQRKDSGEVKIKIKNEFGTTEGISKLIVLGELVLGVHFVIYVFFVFFCCLFVFLNKSSCYLYFIFSQFGQQTSQQHHRDLWRSWRALFRLSSSNGNHPKTMEDAQSAITL